MIRLSQIVKDYQEAGAMNTLIGLSAFVDERCFLTKSGDLGVVFGVAGIDGECLDHAQLDQAARRFEAGVRVFNENFRLYQYMLKRDGARLPHRDYQSPVVQQATPTGSPISNQRAASSTRTSSTTSWSMRVGIERPRLSTRSARSRDDPDRRSGSFYPHEPRRRCTRRS